MNFSAEISVVVCENDDKCNLLIEKAPRCLKKLITIKEVRPATNQRAKNRGIEILYFEDIEKNGAIKNHPEVVSYFKNSSSLIQLFITFTLQVFQLPYFNNSKNIVNK